MGMADPATSIKKKPTTYREVITGCRYTAYLFLSEFPPENASKTWFYFTEVLVITTFSEHLDVVDGLTSRQVVNRLNLTAALTLFRSIKYFKMQKVIFFFSFYQKVKVQVAL